ncbi:MAG: DUF2497 domain-containing protein [Nitratireductor sp.]|nr:DUF2497 domain-containing protein [Nitratireductor sp.]
MGEAAPRDTSMEEILASIRRIIGNDDAEARARAAASEKPVTAPAADAPAMPQTERRSDSRPFSTPVSQRPAEPMAPGGAAAAGSLAALARSMRAGEALEPAPPQPSPGAEDAFRNPGLSPSSLSPRGHSAGVEPQTAARPAAGSLAEALSDGEPAGPTPPSAPAPEARIEAAAPAPQDAVPELVEPELAEPEPVAPEIAPLEAVEPAATEEIAHSAAVTEDDEIAFREALVSPEVQEKVAGSLERLRTALSDHQAAQAEAIMRPMIREWLDANLPDLVEHIVSREIGRIVAAES